MKNKLLLPLLVALPLFVQPALAQEEAPTSTLQAVAPYKFSLGIRTSVGGPAGIQPELHLKYFVRPETALELQAGAIGYKGSYQASLHYLWQPQLLSSSRLRPFAGIGISAVSTKGDMFHEKEKMEIGAAAIATFGIEYTFRKMPLAISLDYRHAVLGLRTQTSQYTGYSRLNTLGLGLKYTFGK